MHLVTLFVISAVALVFLVGLRMLELALGRDIVPARVRDAADVRVVRMIARSRRAYRACKGWVRHQMHTIPVLGLHGLIVVWAWTLKQMLKAVSLVQGKGDQRTRRIVAAHLDAVRAYEKQLRS